MTAADEGWAKHVADILRRNDIGLFATVPDDIVSHVLEHLDLGSLCTIAAEAPKNYALVVWDNEVQQTTGGQPTATAGRASLTAIARGAGVDKTMDVRTEDELRRGYDRISGEDGLFVVCVKIVKGRAEGRFDRDVIGDSRRFKEALALVSSNRR
jgi:hypothetical protein